LLDAVAAENERFCLQARNRHTSRAHFHPRICWPARIINIKLRPHRASAHARTASRDDFHRVFLGEFRGRALERAMDP